jgi:hypothetical protein
MNATVKMAFLSGVMLASVLTAPESRAQSISTGLVTSITGSGAGPSGCSGTSIRWDPGASPNGQVATSQLTSAFLENRQVLFVLNNSCWSEWPVYPTIWYYEIH